MSKWQMRFFRPAKPRSLLSNVVRSLVQTLVIWSVFLFLVPWAIVSLQPVIGIAAWDSAAWKTVAVTVFWSAGASGMHCGWMFVRYGGGTPLPLDQTTRFTVLGLYRFVRNPMSVLGILQGVMVGLYLGSWLVMAYSLLGVVAWEILARPYEEEDLARRFGEEFAAYRSAVPRWLPSLNPYPKVVTDGIASVSDGPPDGGLGQ